MDLDLVVEEIVAVNEELWAMGRNPVTGERLSVSLTLEPAARTALVELLVAEGAAP